MPAPLPPPVKPTSVSSASPGPFTTQPMIERLIGVEMCARQGFNVIETVAKLEERLAHISTPMSLSIIGCVVNGPGEALLTDVGFTGGGKGAGMVYLAGKPDHKMDNAGMVDHIVGLVEARAAELEAANPKALQAAE